MLSRALPVLAVLGVAVAVLVRSHSIPEAHAAPNRSGPGAAAAHVIYTLGWSTERIPAELVARAGARPHRRVDRGIFTLAWQDAPMVRGGEKSRAASAPAAIQPPRFVLAGVTTR